MLTYTKVNKDMTFKQKIDAYHNIICVQEKHECNVKNEMYSII